MHGMQTATFTSTQSLRCGFCGKFTVAKLPDISWLAVVITLYVLVR